MSYTNKPLTIDTILNDLKAVVELLRNRYHQDKIYIAGHSWGAYLGLRFVSMYPGYVKYYIGTGQGVSSIADEIDKFIYEDYSLMHGNFCFSNIFYDFTKKQICVIDPRGQMFGSKYNKVLTQLNHFGEPTGYTYKFEDEKAKRYIGKMVHKYGGYISNKNDFRMAQYLMPYFKCYKLNMIKVLKGIVKSAATLNAEMSQEEISCITELSVPILLISGEDDMICPVSVTQRWFDNLKAPKKEYVIIKNAAHMVNVEQPKQWNKRVIMLRSM